MNNQLTAAFLSCLGLSGALYEHGDIAKDTHELLVCASDATGSNPLTPAGQGPQGPSHGGQAGQGTTSFDVVLTAGSPQFHQDGQHANAVIVKEIIDQHPAKGQLTDTRVGLPNLSVREIDFLLPYNASFTGLNVEILHQVVKPLGVFHVAPNRAAVSGTGGNNTHANAWIPEGIQLGSGGGDVEVYGSQLDYPARAVEIASVAQQRAVRILRLAFHPFRWNPATRQLSKIEHLRLRVSWQQRTVNQIRRVDDLGDPCLPDTISDLVDLGVRVIEGVDFGYQFQGRPTAMDYLIITTDHVIDNSTYLNPFVLMKTAQGFSVGVRSVASIKAIHPAPTTQESVRTYLRSIYKQVGLRYVLIISGHRPDDIGDPNALPEHPIPMFMTWPRGGHSLSTDPSLAEFKDHAERRCPTDMYYAELSMGNNWDRDGDGWAGERKDDIYTFAYSKPKKRYVTDYQQELVVARIPFHSVSRADTCLAASIEYQTTSPYDAGGVIGHVRSQVWMAMGESSWWSTTGAGANDLGDAICAALPAKFEPYKMYQVGAYDELLLANTFINRWSSQFGPGMAIWSGHGNRSESVIHSATSPPLIHADNVAGFTQLSGCRAFVLSTSCLNASPFFDSRFEESATLLDELMKHAAVGAVLFTSISLNNPVRQEDFGDHLFNTDVIYDSARFLGNGRALGDSVKRVRRRGDYSGKGGVLGCKKTMNLLGINAFGDPAIKYDVGWGWLGN